MKKLLAKEYAVKHGKRKFQHELDRRKRLLARRRSRSRPSGGSPLHSKFVHPLMNFLRQHFCGKSTATFDAQKSEWTIPIPPVFSFIKNPQETLNTIYSLVEISRQEDSSAVFFDHSRLVEMDMGASVVLDIVAMNLRNERTKQGRALTFAGAFPKNELLCQVLKSMGITKHLNVKGAEPSEAVERYFVRFPLHTGYRQVGSELGGAQHREKAASHLVQYLDECLVRASRFSFKDEGKSLILKWAGEIITNAEEHSGHRQWFAIGCMTPTLAKHRGDLDADETVIGECQLTILGFGMSIYESLSSEQTPEATREQILALVKEHTGFFSAFQKYSDKDLWTLYALQDGVSRFSPSPGQGTRGKGTVEMIEAFQGLGCSLDPACFPEMSLVSGSTRIYFNNKYHLKDEDVSGGKRKIIAFNAANNLAERPDSNHVHSLDGHFPGTLLTFKFFIDRRYLEKLLETAKKQEVANARND